MCNTPWIHPRVMPIWQMCTTPLDVSRVPHSWMYPGCGTHLARSGPRSRGSGGGLLPCLTLSTLGPYVVQIWSGYEAKKPANFTVWFLRAVLVPGQSEIDAINQQECWLEVDHVAEAVKKGPLPAYCNKMSSHFKMYLHYKTYL